MATCIERCMDMAGVFESCTGSAVRMSAIASTSMTHAHAALLKAARRLLQCCVVQVYDVEWSRVGTGTSASERIPSIRCITPDGTQTGFRGPPLPPGLGAVWRGGGQTIDYTTQFPIPHTSHKTRHTGLR